MKSANSDSKLAKLQKAILDDLLGLSGEALRQELLEGGEDPNRIVSQMREGIQASLAKERRKRLKVAREKLCSPATARNTPVIRPTLDQIKEIVQAVFQRDPSLRLAFREGKRQSESDWQSLYDDLIAIGGIEPNDSGS